MLRTFRLVMIVLVAMFIVAVPTTAMAQSPTTDQYENVPAGGPDDGGSLPDDDAGAPADGGGSAPADDAGGSAPVDVANAPSATSGKLPFTGGQISLIALIGLGLLAFGAIARVASRKRDAAAAA